jgi:hypothetical protein
MPTVASFALKVLPTTGGEGRQEGRPAQPDVPSARRSRGPHSGCFPNGCGRLRNDSGRQLPAAAPPRQRPATPSGPPSRSRPRAPARLLPQRVAPCPPGVARPGRSPVLRRVPVPRRRPSATPPHPSASFHPPPPARTRTAGRRSAAPGAWPRLAPSSCPAVTRRSRRTARSSPPRDHDEPCRPALRSSSLSASPGASAPSASATTARPRCCGTRRGGRSRSA